jgi:hypothetical protein
MGAVKEVFMERCQEWADTINEWYGLQCSDAEVATEVHKDGPGEFTFLWELEQESYTDTAPREAMAEAIAKSRIGIPVPTYGDSEEYQLEYDRKMREWISQNNLSF